MGILIKDMEEIPEDGAVLVVKHDNGKAYIKHACMYGYSMELVKLPAAQPDHNADVSKKAEGDCISRQWLMECVNEGWIKFDTEKDENRFIHLVRDIAPPAQPDLSEYSDKLWRSAYERGKAEAEAEKIRCKDCKHADFAGLGGRRLYCMWNECHMYEDDYCSYAERDTE